MNKSHNLMSWSKAAQCVCVCSSCSCIDSPCHMEDPALLAERRPCPWWQYCYWVPPFPA